MSDSSSPDIDDDAIRAIVTRLARPRADGGHVIERAAILATGPDSAAIEAWILAHTGQAEQQADVSSAGGLHSRRLDPPRTASRRFVLAPGALQHATTTVPR